MIQLLLHLLGDYILQSDKMAQRKTSSYLWAFLHAITYSIPFLFLTHGFNLAWAIIFITHLLIDRHRLTTHWTRFYNLSRIKKDERFSMVMRDCVYEVGDIFTNKENNQKYVITKVVKKGAFFNYAAVKHIENTKPYFNLFRTSTTPTGFDPAMPPFLSTWLMIIIDNTFHLIINYLCLTYLM